MSVTSRRPCRSHGQTEMMRPHGDEWKECWSAVGNSQLSATFHSPLTSTLRWWKGEWQNASSLAELGVTALCRN